MTIIFDPHNHIFPPMARGEAFDEECLNETQYHVRFGGPGGFRRVGDNAQLVEPVMEGDGDGQSNLPWHVTVDAKGELYVADWRNDQIQKFTPESDLLAKYGTSGPGPAINQGEKS